MHRLPQNRPAVGFGVPVAGTSGFNGYGAPYRQQWSYRLPPQQGASNWAWETYLLPRDTAIGDGTANSRVALGVTNPGVMVTTQGVVAYGIGDPGSAAGQYVNQPLLNASTAAALGLASPQAGYNPYYVPGGA